MVLVDGVRMNAFGGGMDLSQVSIAGAERVEVVRGPQSALYGSDAIGGVVQVLTSRGGDPMLDALVEGGGRDARRVAGSARGLARRRLRHAVGAIHGGRGLHRHRAGRRLDRLQRRQPGVGCRGRPRLAGELGNRSVRHVPLRRLGSGLARALRIEPGRQLQRRRSRRPQPDVAPLGRAAPAAAARRRRQPGAAAGRGRCRPTSTSSTATSSDRPARPRAATAACRPTRRWPPACRAAPAASGSARAGAAPTSSPAPARCRSIATSGRRSPRRGGSRPRACRSPAALARRASRGRRCRPTRTASRRGRPFDDDTVVDVNPKVTAAWIGRPRRRRVGDLDQAARRRRHRHPSPGRVRDRLHRQRRAEARAQRQLRSRRHPDAVRRRGLGRGHLVPQQLRRPDRLGRALQLSSRYTTDNIANARARGAELGLTVRPSAPVLGAGHLHLPRQRDPRRGRHRRRGAVAVRRRRPAAAPAAPSGQRRRGLVGRAACRSSGRW